MLKTSFMALVILSTSHATFANEQSKPDTTAPIATPETEQAIEKPSTQAPAFQTQKPQADSTSSSEAILAQHQQKINRHAWHTFTRLMSPVQEQQGNRALRRWETWKEQYEVYTPDGSNPMPWGSPMPIPSACQADGTEVRYLHRDEKIDDVLDAVNQAVKVDANLPGTLTDQYSKVVRYEIRLNRTVFDYIVKNKLYNGEIQAKAHKISFPNGSIIVKAAWRELTGATTERERQQFIIRPACICEDEKQADCHRAEAALVGFHIMHKTQHAPQWIWSTFEHVANVQPSHGLSPNFRNLNCQGQYCAPNSQTPTGIPNQVTQLLPQDSALQALNRHIQAELQAQNSVLSRYQLMSAQWPLPAKHPKAPTTVFEVHPAFSANTTMETFAQDTSSCMGCHVMSRSMKPGEFVSADFSFTLNNAKPQPQGAVCNTYDYANSMMCSDEVILFNNQALESLPQNKQRQIERGHYLVSHTYEALPNNVGNRLHCGSCHLHAGGDPNAAWWVGMDKIYPQTSTDKNGKTTTTTLAGRINGCFERSMNGKALCDDEQDCAQNADMQAIIAYMKWLDIAYKRKCAQKPEGCKPPIPIHGFPALTDKKHPEQYESDKKYPEYIGHPKRGEAVFAQKCAFCHGAYGEGRYANNTYFRPALWGQNSYNVSAGMAKPEMLARFLRWNMPYTSGGLLTAQEAQDIACYIDSHVRPGKDTPSDPDSTQCVPRDLSN